MNEVETFQENKLSYSQDVLFSWVGREIEALVFQMHAEEYLGNVTEYSGQKGGVLNACK